MSRESFEQITVPLDELALWVENPRLLSTKHDEMACIEALLSDKRFMPLLEDIANNGLGINPIVVTRTEGGEYCVRDGNRRVTALKLLDNPELCPSKHEGHKAHIKKLAKDNPDNLFDELECYFTDSEDVVLQYLVSTHSGQRGGAAQVDWDAVMQESFLYHAGKKGPYSVAYRCIIFGEGYGFEYDHDFSISTLARLPLIDLCAQLGINVPDELQAPLTVEAGNRAGAESMVKVLEDVRDGAVTVSTKEGDESSIRANKARQSYVDDVVKKYQEQAAKQANESAESTTESEGSTEEQPQAAASGNQTTRRRATRRSTDRTKFVDSKRITRSVPNNYLKEQNLFAELQRLNPARTPSACVVMLRVFLEATIHRTQESLNKTGGKGLAKKVKVVADELYRLGDIDAQLKDSITTLTTAVDGVGKPFFGIDTIQSMVHSQHYHPDRETANSFWDKLDAFIASCWDRVAKNDAEQAG